MWEEDKQHVSRDKKHTTVASGVHFITWFTQWSPQYKANDDFSQQASNTKTKTTFQPIQIIAIKHLITQNPSFYK